MGISIFRPMMMMLDKGNELERIGEELRL